MPTFGNTVSILGMMWVRHVTPGTLGILSNYNFSIICADWTTIPRQPHTNTVKHRTASLFKAGVSQLQHERNLAVAFMNKVLLDLCHTHSFMLHWWLSSCFKTQLSDRNKDHMACKAYGT